MPAFPGILIMVLLLVLVMTKKVSPVVVPVVMALLGGFIKELLIFMREGILAICTTGVMFIFAILFFGILTDESIFRP